MSYTSYRSYVAIIIAIFFFLQGATYAHDSSTSNAIASLDPERPTVFITGSNRGIGFAFVKHYSQDGWNVIATCRNPDQAEDLKTLSRNFSNIFIEEMDVTDLGEITHLAQKYKDKPIDILINNAGILGNLTKQSFGELDYELFQKVMAVNTFGPLKIAEIFAENVAISDQKKIVSITSGLGSMAIMGNSERFFFYRMSKSALNMGVLALNASLKSKGIIAALISPGMVDTQLLDESGYRGNNKVSPEESAAGLVKVIDNISLETMKKTRGRPTNFDDMILPW
ncbi:MAG: SDR family oxidoreductase [Candidatus Marinimicrobia bacterium]|nr:SDR family oxidoreductase [Candidatus Neomarinimicrobiota bacterium]